MASTMADKDGGTKLKNCSNPSRMRVRIIGKIRGFTGQESELPSKPWIVVRRSPEADACQKVAISFADQCTSRKDVYELDYCYEQDEDNPLIYSREIEPFIPEVFDGRNMSIIAYGAKGSGKTSIIQGTEEKPGLAVMTMAEILSKIEGNGVLVSVSIYEVCHDHVYDLLDVKHPEFQVLEAQGTINLKGLSKVSVKSIREFYNVYFGQSSSQKAGSNISLEPRKTSHKGLIIYISSVDDSENHKLVGKMNFVDLAGYEDSRRCSRDGTTVVESARINKSLYALLNVVHALNAHENRVPYRESKLTHMLKESLGGKSRVLMLTCMNPSFCQDTIHTVSVASRSCQSNAQTLTNSDAGSKSASKLDEFSSARSRKPPFFSAKKQIGNHFSTKKVNSISKGRKLFDAEKTITSEQPKFPLPDTSACESKVLPCKPSTITSLQEEVLKDKFTMSSSLLGFKDDELDTVKDPTLFPLVVKDVSPNNKLPEITPLAIDNSKDMILYQDESIAGTTEKENICMQIRGKGSPPLSEKIRKISDNLKALCSTPLALRIPEEIHPPGTNQVGCGDIVEPKTPLMEHHDMKANDRSEIVKYNSPWESFSQRSSGMKHTLVQEYLKFLNSASKEELKGLKGIGEKRATYILELREESPDPFKRLEDLENIGLSAKQIKGMMRKAAGDLFN